MIIIIILLCLNSRFSVLKRIFLQIFTLYLSGVPFREFVEGGGKVFFEEQKISQITQNPA